MQNRKAASTFGCTLIFISVVIAIMLITTEIPKILAINGPAGRIVSGTVIDKSDNGPGNKHILEATISYLDEQRHTHRVVNSFSTEDWLQLYTGSAVQVRYLSTDPDYGYATTSFKANRKPSVMLGLCFLIFAFGAVFWTVGRFTRH